MKSQYAPAPPVKIPELGGDFDMNFCHNVACNNFGVSWYQSDLDNKNAYSAKKTSKNANLKDVTFKCLKCLKKYTAYDNQALDIIFLRSLKNTLLHAYCQNSDCSNYRINFYENKEKYGIKDKNKKQIYCRYCKPNKIISVGTPTRLRKENISPESIKLFIKLICNNNGPRAVIDILECNPDFYTARLNNISNMLRDVAGYFLMKLNNPNHKISTETICVYTDILRLSVHAPHAHEDSYVFLDLIISSTNYNDSTFILAATPSFYSDSNNIIQKDVMNNRFLKKYSSLYLMGDVKTKPKNKHDNPKYYPTNIGGYFIRKNYLVTAHYLVLRKILSNAKQIILYNDPESIVFKGAVSAFADRIKQKTCDVVVVSTAKKCNTSAKNINIEREIAITSEEKDAHQKKRNIELKKRVCKVHKKLKQIISNPDKAQAFSKVLTTPNVSKKYLWIADPTPPIHEQSRRFLWMTRRLNENMDYEVELYKQGKLQPIDMPFAVFRKTVSFCTRPSMVASTVNATGYDSHARLPMNIFNELTINIFYWNHQLRHLGERYKKECDTRGYNLEVTNNKPITIEDIINWREKVFERAEKITGWRKS